MVHIIDSIWYLIKFINRHILLDIAYHKKPVWAVVVTCTIRSSYIDLFYTKS